MADKNFGVPKEGVSSIHSDTVKVSKEMKKESVNAQKELQNLQSRVKGSSKEINNYLKSIQSYSEEVGGSIHEVEKAFKDFQKNTEDKVKKITEATEELRVTVDVEQREKLKADLASLIQSLESTQKAYETEHKLHAKEINVLKSVTAHYGKLRNRIDELTEKDFDKLSKAFQGAGDGFGKFLEGEFKGIGSVVGSGIKHQILSSMASGVQGKIRAKEAAMTTMGKDSAEYAATAMEIKNLTGSFSMLASSLTGITLGFALLTKLILAVDGNTTKYNKVLTQGIPLAGDLMKVGTDGTKAYSSALRQISDTIINQSEGMFKQFGISGEEAAGIVNSYIKNTSGSLTKAHSEFSNMPSPDTAIADITKSVVVYGKLMGISTDEVTETMGHLYNELDHDFTHINKIMDSVVGAALGAGVPVNKFVSMFRDMVPNIDLFNNRLEETVGVMKELSKTMSPDKLRKTMEVMSKGLKGRSTMDVTHLMLKAGEAESKDIANEKVNDKIKAMSEDLGMNLGKAFKDSNDPEAVAAKLGNVLRAQGKSGAQIDMVRQLGRLVVAQKRMNLGGEAWQMDAATILKEGGDMFTAAKLFASIQNNPEFKDKDISGLGEDVFQKLTGASEEEVEAFLRLQASLKGTIEIIKDSGHTMSEGLDKSLHDVFKEYMIDKGGSDSVDFQEYFGKMDKKGQSDLVYKAMRIQQTKDDVKSQKEQAAHKSAEELAKLSIDETRSILDYLNGVLTTYLEKFLSVFSGMTGILKLWMKDGTSSTISTLSDWSSRSDLTGEAQKSQEKVNRLLIGALTSGASLGEVEAGVSQQVTTAKMSPDDLESLINSINTSPTIAGYDKNIGSTPLNRRLSTRSDETFEIPSLAETLKGLTSENVDERKKVISSLEGLAGGKKNTAEILSMIAYRYNKKGAGFQATEKLTKSSDDEVAQSADLNPAAASEALRFGNQYSTTPSPVSPTDVKSGEKSFSPWGKYRYPGMPAEKSVPAVAKLANQPTTPAIAPAAVVPGSTSKSVKMGVTEIVRDDLSDIYDLLKRVTAGGQGMILSDITLKKQKEGIQNVLEKSLMDLVKVLAKMNTNPAFAKALASDNLTQQHGTFDLSTVANSTSEDFIKFVSDIAPKVATGGYVERSGLAVIHEGENVMPAGQAANGNINVNINFSAYTNATADQISKAIYQTFRQASS